MEGIQYGVGTCSPRLPVVHHAWVEHSFLTTNRTNLTNLAWVEGSFLTAKYVK
jgi:hypothetical protein